MQDLELYLYLHYILLTDRFSVALIPEKLNENAEKSCLTMWEKCILGRDPSSIQ